MSSKGDKIAAMIVKFKWDSAEDDRVVTKDMPDTFLKLLETIDEAPCWNEGGSKHCEVKVEIVMS